MIADPPMIPEATLRARQAAAARYPETLVDTKGRKHRCIPREAILRGDWDRALTNLMDEKEARG